MGKELCFIKTGTINVYKDKKMIRHIAAELRGPNTAGELSFFIGEGFHRKIQQLAAGKVLTHENGR